MQEFNIGRAWIEQQRCRHCHPWASMSDGSAAPSVFNVTDRTSGPVICSYMTGWGSHGRESEETTVDRSLCYLGILGLEGAYWLEPPTKGQPLKRGQKLCSQSVLYSEVPLYSIKAWFLSIIRQGLPLLGTQQLNFGWPVRTQWWALTRSCGYYYGSCMINILHTVYWQYHSSRSVATLPLVSIQQQTRDIYQYTVCNPYTRYNNYWFELLS